MTAPIKLMAMARAKINLCLHITGQRPDGYHNLDSIVVFPKIGDLLEITPARDLSLSIDGPFAAGVPVEENSIIRAAQLMPNRQGARIKLTKNLPHAAGIGGGSSDAATAVKLFAKLWDIPLPNVASILSLGADVPVCMSDIAQHMQGVGEVLEPIISLPEFSIVLVNCGIAVPTSEIFNGLKSKDNPKIDPFSRFETPAEFFDFLGRQRNDMQHAAFELVPETASVINTLQKRTGCKLARMSGSGATCFGLFETQNQAGQAAQSIIEDNPEWWVVAGLV